MTGFRDGSGISWTIYQYKQSRQITTPTPYHSIFTGRMPFLDAHQLTVSNQSTEDTQLQTSITTTMSDILLQQIMTLTTTREQWQTSTLSMTFRVAAAFSSPISISFKYSWYPSSSITLYLVFSALKCFRFFISHKIPELNNKRARHRNG